jgi:hypothetical protein
MERTYRYMHIVTLHKYDPKCVRKQYLHSGINVRATAPYFYESIPTSMSSNVESNSFTELCI